MENTVKIITQKSSKSYNIKSLNRKLVKSKKKIEAKNRQLHS